jgi:hypothetical protein
MVGDVTEQDITDPAEVEELARILREHGDCASLRWDAARAALRWFAGKQQRQGPVIYTAEEAAVILKCTASWLKERARRREHPFTLLGGSYRWTPGHLKEIVRLGEQQPSPPAVRRAAPRPGISAAPGTVPVLRARESRRRKPAA